MLVKKGNQIFTSYDYNRGEKSMNYYNKIKDVLINNEVYKKVKDYSKNKNELNSYYEVGKLLVEARGWRS